MAALRNSEKIGKIPMHGARLTGHARRTWRTCAGQKRGECPMVNVHGMARLGVLAVGLGVGAA
jgi:hypothetical protein